MDALKNEDSRIRMGAAMVLGEIKNPAAMDSLVKMKKDKDPLVRQFARSAIYMIKRENLKKERALSKHPRSC